MTALLSRRRHTRKAAFALILSLVLVTIFVFYGGGWGGLGSSATRVATESEGKSTDSLEAEGNEDPAGIPRRIAEHAIGAALPSLKVVDSLGIGIAGALAFPVALRERWIETAQALAQSDSAGRVWFPPDFSDRRVAVGSPGYLTRVVELRTPTRPVIVVLDRGLERRIHCKTVSGDPIPGVLVALGALPVGDRNNIVNRLRGGGVPGRVTGHLQFGVTDANGDVVLSGLPTELHRNHLYAVYSKDGYGFQRSNTSVGPSETATGHEIFGARIKIIGDEVAAWTGASTPKALSSSLDYGACSDARRAWSNNADIVLAAAQRVAVVGECVTRIDVLLKRRGWHSFDVSYQPYAKVVMQEVDVTHMPEDSDLASLTIRLLSVDGLPFEWSSEAYLYLSKVGSKPVGPNRSPATTVQFGKTYPVGPGTYALGSKHSLYRLVLPRESVTVSRSEVRTWDVRLRRRIVRVPIVIREASGTICDLPRFLIKTPLGLAFFQTASGRTELLLPEGQALLKVAPPACRTIERTIDVVPGMPAIELETTLK